MGRAARLDVVYVVRPGDDNEELRFSLRSLVNLPHGDVWIAGHKPPWVRNVNHVPTRQSGSKFDNSTANLSAAAAEVSGRFVYMNDDFFITEPIPHVPMLHNGPVADQFYPRIYDYGRGAHLTAALLASHGVPDPLSYELHVPMEMDSGKLLEALRVADGVSPLHKRTLYGNLFDVGGDEVADPKAVEARGPLPTGPFLSTNKAAWAGDAGRHIRRMFPNPSRFEVSPSGVCPGGDGRTVTERRGTSGQ